MPQPYCRTCFLRYQKVRQVRVFSDPVWMERERVRVNRNSVACRTRKRKRRRQEYGAVAVTVLRDLYRRGLSRSMIERVAGVRHETQERIERTGELKYPAILERLLALQGVVRDVPAWERPATGARHPHEDLITYRYEALRAAHA
jgi:hypothetical protein